MKVFVMIDMQNDFISGALGNAETREVLPLMGERLKEAVADDNTAVLYTLDTHYENYMETKEGRNLPVPHCIKGTNGHRIADELLEILADTDSRAVEKITFGSTALASEITEMCGGIPDEIELAGVCTDICVISNAMLLKSAFPEVDIIVNSKCSAGTSPKSHNRALDAMKMCQITII